MCSVDAGLGEFSESPVSAVTFTEVGGSWAFVSVVLSQDVVFPPAADLVTSK